MEKIKVLIPTDFSVQAEYAYLMVKKLEEKIETEIHFLHIMDAPDTVFINETGTVQTCGEIYPGYIRSQKNIADRKLTELKITYGPHIHTHFELGKVTDKILSFSQKNQFDLIVMGTKGAWGIKEKLAGSETQIIARQSPIPLLSLMCDRSDLVIEHLLLVHDFNRPENQNLGLLHILLKAFNPTVHLLQIMNGSTKKESVLSHMDEYAQLNGIDNFKKHLLTDSDIESGVIHFNQMLEMDIVCIGTHGRGGFMHTSITEKLINHLYKPIISFHLKN
ncbi:MAG: universal stress protein [Sphingobacteriales bacterium]|nr:universal stress protein [Sphingobacteriales bacterium]